MKFGVPHWEFQRSGPWRVSLQYPFWTMMSFVGGFVLLTTHWVRHTTQDYLFNALAGLFVVVLLVIPAVKKRLRLTPEPEAVEPQAV